MTYEADLNVHSGCWESRPSAGDLQRAAKPLTPEQVAEAESRRAAAYAAKQTELAAARFAEQEWHRLGDALEAVAARKEELASAHVATAAPLQARLKSLEEQIITSIKNREAVSPNLEAERTEVLNKIQELNSDLKTKISREDSIVAQIEAERLTAAKAAIVGQLEQAVLQLAPPALRIELAVARQSLRWAEARLSAAREAKKLKATRQSCSSRRLRFCGCSRQSVRRSPAAWRHRYLCCSGSPCAAAATRPGRGRRLGRGSFTTGGASQGFLLSPAAR